MQGNDKKVSAMYSGPVENSHVANYRKALTHFPISLNKKKWTEAEKENLGKGIRQQFQEMVLQFSVDQFRYVQLYLQIVNVDCNLEGKFILQLLCKQLKFSKKEYI